MPRIKKQLDTLSQLVNRSDQPIYAVDDARQIVYCNPALATWLGLAANEIVGRLVEYHSASTSDAPFADADASPLTDLCPPPRALAGYACTGTVSCQDRLGRLVHRQAEFVPLIRATTKNSQRSDPDNDGTSSQGTLVFLASDDMSREQLSSELAPTATSDELHRAIRRFRRTQTGRYVVETLIGTSSAMVKVRSQVHAAATSGANALIVGRPGSGRGHVARAIHYQGHNGSDAKLIPLKCDLLTDDMLRRAFDSLRDTKTDSQARTTLLLENLDRISDQFADQILDTFQKRTLPARLIATVDSEDAGGKEARHAALLNAISTITIRMPRLIERLEDLPLLTQIFLEECNRGGTRQVGSIRSHAVDLLSLYDWPGEVEQLRQVIATAHDSCESHEILPANLPPILHHALQKATHMRSLAERVVLDDLMAKIEREVIVRALAQANGNKSEAAAMLGLSRPRLYRKLVQHGLVKDDEIDSATEVPVFIEHDPETDAS